MAQHRTDSPHPEPLQITNDPMDEDEERTPRISTISPNRSHTGSPASMLRSQSGSSLLGPRYAGVQRSKSKTKNPNTPMEQLRFQLTEAFHYVADQFNQNRDETHIALDSLSKEAQEAYHALQLVERRLANGEEVVGAELTSAKANLERFQGEAKTAYDNLTAQIAQALQEQQQQQQQDTKRAEARDLMLDQAMVTLSKNFDNQAATWAAQLKKQEDEAAEQKEAA